MLKTKRAEAQVLVVQGMVLQVLVQVMVQAVQDLLMERVAVVVALAQAVPLAQAMTVQAVLVETRVTTMTMTHHHLQSLAMAHATMMANLRHIDIAAVRK